MTLIITTVSPSVVTMVGDRRLTFNNKVVKERASKQGHLLSSFATSLYGYTGVAEVGTFRLNRWIGDALLEATKQKELPFPELMDELARLATKEFKSHYALKRLDKSISRTTIVFAGFLANGTAVACLISNFENGSEKPAATAWTEFKATPYIAKSQTPDASAIFITGNTGAVEITGLTELNALLLKLAPIKALIGKSTKIILDASDSIPNDNTIGKNLMQAYLPRPSLFNPSPPTSRFVSAENSISLYTLDKVDTRLEARIAIADVGIVS